MRHFVWELSSGARSSCGIIFGSRPRRRFYAGGKISACCLVLFWIEFTDLLLRNTVSRDIPRYKETGVIGGDELLGSPGVDIAKSSQ